MNRIFLYILTNLAVVLVLSASLHILGVDRFLSQQGLNVQALLVFSLVVGFSGSIISLFMSKFMAKKSTGAIVIDPQAPGGPRESWLVDTVHQLADRAGIGRPEVAIYEGEPNAFATGAFRNEALVAVSTGLLDSMTEEEIATVLVCELAFGVVASVIVAWFSRRREYRADAGSASLLSSREPMIRALARLGGLTPGELPRSFEASGISGRVAVSALFATHPPIAARIQALQQMRVA